MDVDFESKDLRLCAEEPEFAQQKLGVEIGRRYTLRITALRAARNLGVFFPPFSGPELCHELEGSLAGTFSVDLKRPYRLLFAPTKTILADLGIDLKKKWEAVTSIAIIEIKEAHE